jgi:hypothetical protein
MGGKARRGRSWGGVVLAGLVPAGLLVASALPSGAAASTEGPAPRVVEGGVAADGATALLPDDLRFERVTDGVYRLRSALPLEAFDVTRWDAVAQVTIVPLAGADHEIRFVGAGGPVDTPFSFRVESRR